MIIVHHVCFISWIGGSQYKRRCLLDTLHLNGKGIPLRFLNSPTCSRIGVRATKREQSSSSHNPPDRELIREQLADKFLDRLGVFKVFEEIVTGLLYGCQGVAVM